MFTSLAHPASAGFLFDNYAGGCGICIGKAKWIRLDTTLGGVVLTSIYRAKKYYYFTSCAFGRKPDNATMQGTVTLSEVIMRYLEKHEVPPVFTRAFPEYTGRKYRVEVAETVSISDDSWSGGSRTEYRGVDILTGEVFAPRQKYGNMFENPSGHIPVVPLEEGKAIVTHSYFCGRDSGITIYVHPNNVNKLLPPPEGGLTDDEYIVIEYTCSLKSSYGGVSNCRFHEANRRTGITPQRWETAKASLQSRGYLDKRGAVTLKGRNARKK